MKLLCREIVDAGTDDDRGLFDARMRRVADTYYYHAVLIQGKMHVFLKHNRAVSTSSWIMAKELLKEDAMATHVWGTGRSP